MWIALVSEIFRKVLERTRKSRIDVDEKNTI
jgi:hypothetical protein